ncbi:MAG TPA: response regulator [Polyangiaceae bacterium]|jgi:DNA-binding response OmpR family regulator
MSGDEKRPLGKILLQRKLVSQQELESALKAQRRSTTPAPLASVLVEEGTVDEVEALRALSEQHGVPGIDLTQVAVVLDHLDVVPREVAQTHRILPVLVRGDRIFLAMADPHDKRVIDELEFVTGKKVYPYIAMHSTLTKTIQAAYDAKAHGERHYLGPRVPEETLRQLGLAPSAPALPPTAAAAPPPGPAAKPAVPPRAAPPAPPTAKAPPAPPRPAGASAPAPPAAPRPLGGRPQAPPLGPMRPKVQTSPPRESVVVEEAMQTSSENTEVSTSEFGAVGQDISSVANLPDELRVRAGQAAAAVGAGAGKLILVVDDEEEIRTLLKRLLTGKGYRVIEADRGLLALRLVKDHVPDLIILDAMLPELHGFDIAKRIKGSAKYGRIPIIMVSAVYRGWRIAEDLKQNYGIEDYLEKPFRIQDITEAVQRLLAREDLKPSESKRDPEYLSSEAEKALAEGIAAYKAGEMDAAIEHLKRGVGIDPLAYRLHFHLALLYGKMGKVYEGIQELERAIDLNPKHFAALKNLAVLYEKAGFKNKAVEMWERCAAAAPDEPTRASIKEHFLKLI